MPGKNELTETIPKILGRLLVTVPAEKMHLKALKTATGKRSKIESLGFEFWKTQRSTDQARARITKTGGKRASEEVDPGI